jgi:hypothetical protein
MASRLEIENEIASLGLDRPDRLDIVRRQKYARVTETTGHALLIYAVDFTTANPVKAQLAGRMMSISLEDKDGFDQVTRNIKTSNVDVMLHSPGGSAEATESIVELLRSRFSKVRFIIPSVAKSAATMLAMSGNQLLMDELSELGPIDPQMQMVRDNQFITAPAQAVKDQFEFAQEDINKDPNRLPAWVPILRQYGPSLLAECDNHLALSEHLVAKWLQQFMFAGQADAEAKATAVGRFLNDHNYFRSHARRVGINELQQLGMDVLDMRTQPELHEAVRDAYTALMITFQSTGVVKLFENSNNEGQLLQIHAEAITEQRQTQEFPSNKNPSQGKRRK